MQNRRFYSKTISLTAALAASAAFVVAAPLSFAAGGGNSAPHLNSQGLNNSNGSNSLDRDTALNRAQDRMSEQGLDHSKAKDPKSHDPKKLSKKDKH